MASSGGGNKISYGLDRPEYEYSTSTTQFDDELMRRDVITFEQAMMAKGASAAEARRLASVHRCGDESGVGGGETKNGKRIRAARRPASGSSGDTNEDDDDDDDDGRLRDEEECNSSDAKGRVDDDDEFLASYRRMRLRELRSESRCPHGDVRHISRPDWTREVNEASRDGTWVLVNLTRGSDAATVSSRHVDACEMVERAASDLAKRFPRVKVVSIAASAANEDWPPYNLPTMFCYRDGRLQHQLIGVEEFGGHGITTDRVEWRLAQLGVLQTTLEEDPERGRYELAQCEYNESRTNSTAEGGGVAHSQFGGMMSTWATRRDSDEEEDLSDID